MGKVPGNLTCLVSGRHGHFFNLTYIPNSFLPCLLSLLFDSGFFFFAVIKFYFSFSCTCSSIEFCAYVCFLTDNRLKVLRERKLP